MPVATPSRQQTVDPAVLQEAAKAVADFPTFLRYVYIQDPVRGQVRWQAWPYLLEMARAFITIRLLVILKARQLGISWLVAAYVLWHCLQRDRLVLLFSQGELEAWEMIRKVEYIRTRLPAHWIVRRTNDAKTDIELANGSAIRAMPSTEKAGSGFTASLVVADEHAKHPYAQANWATIEPTINAGGQFISLSTNWGAGEFFQNLYMDAKRGLNNFTHKFLGCMLRPGRDQAWYDATKRNFKGLLAYFTREYPRTEQEALSSVEGICAFDLDVLNRLLETARPPLLHEEFPLGYVKQWQRPIIGHRYVCGTDVTYGLAATDAGASQVLDVQTGAHVASLWCHLPPEEMIARTVRLCQEYNNTFVGVEENGVGQFAIRALQNSGYTNVYYRDAEEAYKAGKQPVKLGWHTGANRPVLVAALGAAYRNGQLITWDEDTISESRTFVIERGREEAAKGCHDDRVMALGIAWQMRGDQAAYVAATSSGKPLRTRTFITPR